jgi:exodeoxyribonuclease V beta subunit
VSAIVHDTAFDVCGTLPAGVTVLEASAGTGKTYTIAGLTARYVAEGHKLEELLLVTFTRMATAELRDRVRERLVSAEHGLERALGGEPPDERDRVLALLASGDQAGVEQRRRRLAAAIADFDAATIVTTHGFCQEVLGGLGIAGDLEPGVTFAEDLSDLREEVVDDLYVRAFHRARAALGGREKPPFERSEALMIARAADENPGAALEPTAVVRNSLPDLRRRFAARVREELDERKRRGGVMTYDDLLTRLRDALFDPRRGGEIAARLRDRYRVVLVDEFQDTDPLQWDIVRRAFGEGDGTLVLIGDPKQAIYAFRGADVYAYLDAAATAGANRTLDTNWRGDQPLLTAYDALFGDAQLGHPGIVYRRVSAAAANQRSRLTGAPHAAPLRVRLVPGAPRGGRQISVDDARGYVAEDLAGDVVALLDARAEIQERRADGTPDGPARRLEPGDVAVLVRRNLDAEAVRDALARAGVPAVLSGAGSVFSTREAGDWLSLLEALEGASRMGRVRAVALTAFVGWTAERVATADEDAWDELQSKLHRWALVLRTRGVAALAESVSSGQSLPGRVLAVADGERRMTDLRHVGELLHAAAMTEQLGPAALTTWLRHRIRNAAAELGNEERTRRLESDAAAVQVLTIHRSKGLEFPVVYLPYAWDPSPAPRAGKPVAFHDEDAGDARKVDVGLEGREYQLHRQRGIVEQRGEDLRLLYVGLTRARHQAVVWWAGTSWSKDSALARLAFHREPDGTVPHAGRYTPDDDRARERFEELAARAPGCISVEQALLGGPAAWSPPLTRPAVLDALTFDRSLDAEWRRTSYSDITAGAHEAHVASEPEARTLTDEPEADAAPPAAARAGVEEALLAVALPLSDLPGGVRVGTFVHDVLEATDFAADDLERDLTGHVRRLRPRAGADLGPSAAIVAGLRAAIETPLGPLAGGLRLRDVTRADRLDELAFELPLAGGDAAAGEVTPAAIGALLGRHLADDDPLAPYAERLGDPALRHAVRGYLTGSIDLVLRTSGDDGTPRFAVVDYKTNRLGAVDEQLTAWHHRPDAIAAEMRRAHYVLQALLYTAALHRYLRWRLQGYDPARNLAGVLYLFVRGMIGPDTPVVGDRSCGVFAWRPPAALVVELSDLLDRGGTG